MWIPLSILSILILINVAETRNENQTIDRAFRSKTTDDEIQAVDRAFRRYNIVPQIIPVSPPAPVLEIFADHIVNLGNTLPIQGTIVKPYATYRNVHYNRLYTLIALAPDDGGFNTGTQFLWGMVTNIPGPYIRRGDTLAPYVPPNPLPGHGLHRYITLIYLQRRRIPITTELVASVCKNIRNFNITEFVTRLNLGDPVAGNFFLTRQSLPKPYQQQNSMSTCDTHGVDLCCEADCF